MPISPKTMRKSEETALSGGASGDSPLKLHWPTVELAIQTPTSSQRPGTKKLGSPGHHYQDRQGIANGTGIKSVLHTHMTLASGTPATPSGAGDGGVSATRTAATRTAATRTAATKPLSGSSSLPAGPPRSPRAPVPAGATQRKGPLASVCGAGC